jgi:aspartate kinase
MREVADIVCSFPEHLPCVVLSAMGKVRNAILFAMRQMYSVSVKLQPVQPFLHMQTTNLLLQAGDEALRTAPASIASLAPLKCAPALHGNCKDCWPWQHCCVLVTLTGCIDPPH